jgi:hypothetical protein
MPEPTIIKGPLPGQAVEEFRLRNGGKLPGANVVVSLDMVDDALSLLEGWIERYCNSRFREEHFTDLAKKREHLARAPEAPVSETSTPASDAAQRILQLTKALEQSVRVVRVWHAMPQKPSDADAFDLYFNHSPEMKLIRDALGKMPEG